jgi:hypothetical protein
MKKLIIVSAIAAISLTTGCATTSDYNLYAQTQQIVAQERAKTEIARANALKEIASFGDSASKVAAVMSLQFAAQTQPAPSQQITAPTSFGDTALKWASLLVPSLTQFYSIGKSADIAVVNSNNSLEGKKSDNGMVVDLVHGRIPPIIGNKTDADGATEEFLLYPR